MGRLPNRGVLRPRRNVAPGEAWWARERFSSPYNRYNRHYRTVPADSETSKFGFRNSGGLEGSSGGVPVSTAEEGGATHLPIAGGGSTIGVNITEVATHILRSCCYPIRGVDES